MSKAQVTHPTEGSEASEIAIRVFLQEDSKSMKPITKQDKNILDMLNPKQEKHQIKLKDYLEIYGIKKSPKPAVRNEKKLLRKETLPTSPN